MTDGTMTGVTRRCGRGIPWLMALVAGIATGASSGTAWAQAANALPAAEFRVEFTNVKLLPPHWVLSFDESGKGRFIADPGEPSAGDKTQIQVGSIDRPIALSGGFTQAAFAIARKKRLFAYPCDGHLKVAFQGMKKLSYAGPEGTGTCEYNYSKDKEIQSLGDQLLSVAATLVYGARLEKLLQHDRLGMNDEMDGLVAAAHDGNAIEMGVIREILQRIAGDDQVLERVRKKARLLLSMAG